MYDRFPFIPSGSREECLEGWPAIAGAIGSRRGARSVVVECYPGVFVDELERAVRVALPPLTNRTISITKNTALGSAIGVNEILGQATSAEAFSANATPLAIAAALYVALFIPLVIASRRLERRYSAGSA